VRIYSATANSASTCSCWRCRTASSPSRSTYTDTYIDWGESFTQGLFQVVSIGTTTGFTTAQFYYWPPFIEILLLFLAFVGGCAGSTGGGIKVIRLLLLIKQGLREIGRLIHPNAQLPVRIGGKVINHRIVDAVWGFFSLYVAAFTVIMYLALAATSGGAWKNSVVAKAGLDIRAGLRQYSGGRVGLPRSRGGPRWAMQSKTYGCRADGFSVPGRSRRFARRSPGCRSSRARSWRRRCASTCAGIP
jgi:hypothetical protein